MGSGVQPPRWVTGSPALESWLYHSLAVQSWVSCLTSQYLGFLMYQIEESHRVVKINRATPRKTFKQGWTYSETSKQCHPWWFLLCGRSLTRHWLFSKGSFGREQMLDYHWNKQLKYKTYSWTQHPQETSATSFRKFVIVGLWAGANASTAKIQEQ